MKATKEYKRAVRTFVWRLMVCALIIVGGCLYPVFLRLFDAGLRADPDFAAGSVAAIAACVGITYAVLACFWFYDARQDLRYYAAHPITEGNDHA
jgi:hypothetical protein